ncbi:hypothetical protein [Sphingomonas sp.]|uniref:hypothetical protein n=1 Tax=Sphingomonas sp. TaxID=28214 RepID=UPI0025D6AFCD|nr:hypothetical protein [Sphingomonas sp.]
MSDISDISDIEKTGGPAFPLMREIRYGQNWDTEEGMTLRDYFAAKAMQPMLAEWRHRPLDEFAELAYSMADAMLKARIQ